MKIEWISSLKIMAASLSSAIIVYILLKLAPLNNPIYGLAIGGTLYIISYLILAPILGALNMEDIENLEGLTKELILIYPVARRILRLEKKILKLKIIPFKSPKLIKVESKNHPEKKP